MGDSTEGAAAAEKTAGELRLAQATQAAIETVAGASPQKHCVKVIEWAASYLDLNASEEARIAVGNQIQGFAREAADLLERGNFSGLNAAISAFGARVRDAASIAPPRPPLMPDAETFRQAGWSSAERQGLETILMTAGMCGLPKGDSCVSIDDAGATLASGQRLTKSEIVAANRPAWMKDVAVRS